MDAGIGGAGVAMHKRPVGLRSRGQAGGSRSITLGSCDARKGKQRNDCIALVSELTGQCERLSEPAAPTLLISAPTRGRCRRQ